MRKPDSRYIYGTIALANYIVLDDPVADSPLSAADIIRIVGQWDKALERSMQPAADMLSPADR